MSRIVQIFLLALISSSAWGQWDELTHERAEKAAGQYQQYCALCHGEDRQGWISLGYPIVSGTTESVEVIPLHEPSGG